MKWAILNIFMFISFQSSCIKSQQQYLANQPFNCTNKSLYTCNGQRTCCTSFLVFKSQPPYNSVATISALMSASPSNLARINKASKTTIFPDDKEIIIPVNCCCSNEYYQSVTSYHIEPQSLTYFDVANNTFQGLSTCGSLIYANVYDQFELKEGFELKVPLRCACPTKDQILNGTKYLLTYRLSFGDNVNLVARRFNVTAESVLTANGISEADTLYALTALLIPLPDKPYISPTVIQRYNPPNSLTSVRRSKANKSIKAEIAGACSVLVFIVVLVTVVGMIYMRRKRNSETENEILPADLLAKISSFKRITKVYSFKDLQTATENFDIKHWIKGSVYQGTFGNQILAVKKTSIDVCTQVNMLSKINHINLVKLYGFCKHRESWYLVLEYMKMGSLKDWLKEPRSLRTRIMIAIDVATGLRYLHNFTKPGYVHNNVNTCNIVLDGDLRAKITNFILARPIDERNDNRILGTRGYMAPEYVEKGLVTSKVDVYAFGVVLLELVTRKDVVFRYGGQEVLLSTTVGAIMEGENAQSCEMVDLAIEENGSMGYALQVVRLSLNCLKHDPESRPCMDEIVSSLVKIQVDLQTDAGCRRKIIE